MKCIIKNDKIQIQSLYSEKELVKAIGDYRWNKTYSCWEFPIHKLIDIIEKLRIEYDQDVQTAYDQAKIEQKELEEKYKKAEAIKAGAVDRGKYDKGLFFHQAQTIALADQFDSFGIFLSMGLGKGLTYLEIFLLKKKKENKKNFRAICIMPLSTIESCWVEDIKKFHPELKHVNLWKDKELKEGYDLYLVNFEQFRIRLKEFIKFGFDIMIVDESSKLKSHKSLISKSIMEMSHHCKYKYIGSGMPAPNNLLEYFSQMYVINPLLLGSNFWAWRNKTHYSTGYGGYLYLPYKNAKESIMKEISKQAFFVEKETALDLPEVINETRFIEMDELQKKKYDEMLKQNITELKNKTILAPNELAKLMKLRQATSGFFYSVEGVAIKLSDSKINELKNVLEEIGNHQVIIWVQFREEIRHIQEVLGDSCAQLYGDMPQKLKNLNIKTFRDGKIQYLIANSQSGGFGLNFPNCSYNIWYSLSYSNEIWSQANERIRRPDQTQKCTYVYLLSTKDGKKTIDQVIYDSLIKKRKLSDSCLAFLQGKNGS